MKHFSIRKFSLCFLSLLFVAAVGLGIGKTLTKKVQAADFAYTDVIISSLHTQEGFTWYNFSGHDYAGHSSTSLKTEEYLAKLNTLNTLSKIKLDGSYIGGTFTDDQDPYIDLYTKGGFTIKGTAASEVIIEAGCEFPSYAFMTGTSTAVYRTKADAKFTLVDGAWIKTREEKDITAAVTASDWSTEWSTDTTQIMLLLNSGDLDVQDKYVNDNPTAYDVDLAEYIFINEKSARAIITDNSNKVTNYKGTRFPMDNGGIFSPVLVYGGNNYVSVIILNKYIAQGGFEITVKAGFTVAINDAKCIIKNDLYFGYIQAFNGSEVVTAFTQKYKVTWNVDGNETVEYVAKDYVPEFKGSTDKASTVDKDFTFTGWDVTPAKLTSDVTYTAVYEESARKYNVTFDNGEAVEYAYGSKIEKPANPTKDSTAQYEYTFIGWYNGETAWNFEEGIVTDNVNLTAKFAESIRKYTVTFNGENSAEYEYGSKITKPAEDPAKANTAQYTYTFDGWYNGDTKWNFETDVVTSDVALVAGFTETVNKYTVTVKFEGIENLQDVVLTLDYGTAFNLNDYNKEGFTAKLTDEEGNELTGLTITADTVVKVVYSAETKPSSGCSGNISGTAFLPVALLLGVAILRKKKEN